ncbi:DUF3102 domain-containing protein [Desulfonatronovibrio hydrogenovorans]|uniref:DUF3102 domain-containing protein n=1 Tax=Desulfonatronovibrio hydrogenovorans TaxID=53245 RepID=UPI00048FDF19|nr:DUF3102 domain-containing protein [Desulfonatronovibrio hydrogenovorans]
MPNTRQPQGTAWDTKSIKPVSNRELQEKRDTQAETFYQKKISELAAKRKRQSGPWGKRAEDALQERLDLLATEIKYRIKLTKHHIFTIGELLYEARIMLSGKYQAWVEETFDFSYHTANNFMNVYEQLLGHKDIVEKIPASILYKLATKSFPEDLRQFLIASGLLDKMTNKHFDEVVSKYKDQGFEAVKKEFNCLHRKTRIYEQVNYNLNQLNAAIKALEKSRANIEQYGQSRNNYGEDPDADKINWKISDTLDEIAKQLKLAWSENTQALRNLLDVDSKEIKEKYGPTLESFRNKIILNAKKQIAERSEYDVEDDEFEREQAGMFENEMKIIAEERKADLEGW